jgi:mannitol-specific phosphotransferase system IIBC component
MSLNPGAVFWIGILDRFKTLAFLLFGKIKKKFTFFGKKIFKFFFGNIHSILKLEVKT